MDFRKEVDAAAEVAGFTNRSLLNTTDPTKELLLKIISENPGIWYRELLRMTGISNGTLTYHLRALEESSRIKVQRIDHLGKTRYYSVSVSEAETTIIGCAKNATAKQIMLLLLDRDFCTFAEIVDSVAKSPSTLSWHLKRLVASGVVSIRYGDLLLYSLADKNSVMEVLSKYKESLIDTLANNYSDVIDQL